MCFATISARFNIDQKTPRATYRIVCSALGIFSSSLLPGCASITATPLAADGVNAVPGAQPGFRYYIPRPYLLVAEMPASKSGQGGQKKAHANDDNGTSNMGTANIGTANIGTANIGTANIGTANVANGNLGKPSTRAPGIENGAPGAATPNPGTSTTGQKNGSTGTTTAADTAGSAPATDTSFVATNGTTYIAKLIYLPDYSRPMAVEINSGLLGISKADMTLQDGWMLTSVSANVDNSKMGDVLTAAIQALSGTATGGASKAAKAATAPGAAPPSPTTPYDRALRPGLYAFDYDYGMSRVSFLCAISYFQLARKQTRGSR